MQPFREAIQSVEVYTVNKHIHYHSSVDYTCTSLAKFNHHSGQNYDIP